MANRSVNTAEVGKLYRNKSASNIRSITYQEDKELLEICFYSGGTYLYAGVPSDIYRQFAETHAKDEYLIRNIKTKYRCNKILTV